MTLTHPMIACAAALLLAAAVPNPSLAQTEAETEVQVEVPAPPGEEAETEVVAGATLYQRLGGYDVIAQGVDDVLQRMADDDRLQEFLEPLSEAELRRVRQQSVDFLCQRTGGPCFYTGPDLAAVHEATGITAADWERAAEVIAATLDAHGITGELRDELGGFIAGLRDEIVNQE